MCRASGVSGDSPCQGCARQCAVVKRTHTRRAVKGVSSESSCGKAVCPADLVSCVFSPGAVGSDVVTAGGRPCRALAGRVVPGQCGELSAGIQTSSIRLNCPPPRPLLPKFCCRHRASVAPASRDERNTELGTAFRASGGTALDPPVCVVS